jgi:hypothetical protein
MVAGDEGKDEGEGTVETVMMISPDSVSLREWASRLTMICCSRRVSVIKCRGTVGSST